MAARRLVHHHGVMQTAEQLASSPLFAGLGRQALRDTAALCATEHWPKHRLIAGRDDTVRRLRIIARGHVKIVRSSAQGRELTLWLLGPGDAFDFVSLMDGRAHAVSAWSLDEVTTLSAPLLEMRRRLELYPPLRLAAHRYVAGKLRELTELASDLALHDTSTRLAHVLLRQIASRPSQRSGLDPLRDLSRDDLASLVGTVRVVVSRALGDMRREGILAVHRGELHIANIKRLLLRAEGRLEEHPTSEVPQRRRQARK
jgi:CRP/FNR family transcriptional regulator, cyclic AMP receptor protein